jgi:hypothetical protein
VEEQPELKKESSMIHKRCAQAAVIGLGLLALLFAGCSSVEIDKAALAKVKTVAVVLYTVPVAIQVRDDPRGNGKNKKASAMDVLKAVATASVNTGDGARAATLAEASFIDTLNQQGLPFKAVTTSDMQANAAFMTLAREQREAVQMALAKAAEEREKKQSGASKALSMLASFGGGGASEETPIGASPDGLPSFGLVGDWNSAKGALIGIDREHDYLVKAAEALGVDAVVAINDPGFSWGCETCVGNTGNASTQSAFLVTIVDRSGKPILQMRQWFSIGGGNAAMIAGVINPLQHDGLFKGHGEKTARVFADFYKEQAEK